MKAFFAGWAQIERWLLVVVLSMMIGFAVLQIVLRNVFDTSLFWIDPFNRILVLWLAMLGAMVATRQGEHIAIDAIKLYLPDALKIWVVRAMMFFSSLVTGLMAYHSGRFVYDEFVYGSTTFSNLPIWPFQFIMPVGFAVMALRFGYRIFVQDQPIQELSK